GGFEFSNRLQSIEIYTPRREGGELVGLHHEVILYDEEAFAEPLRIVHLLDRQHDSNEGDPFTFMECIPQSFPVEGETTPMAPGQVFEYRVPDIFDRPWADIWERYHEEGMQGPERRT